MPTNIILGELEQLVLLAILQLEDSAHASSIRRGLDERIGRSCSRGALYRTLDRLEEKGLVEWELEAGTPRRGGHPRRRFQVTQRGVRLLRTSRRALLRLWSGLEGVLG